jgi:hypothetical protein
MKEDTKITQITIEHCQHFLYGKRQEEVIYLGPSIELIVTAR